MLEITNVGISMDSLQRSVESDCIILRGEAVVYSEEHGVNYCDDFDFSYNITEDFLIVYLESADWADYYNEIEDILLDNIKTNVL